MLGWNFRFSAHQKFNLDGKNKSELLSSEFFFPNYKMTGPRNEFSKSRVIINGMKWKKLKYIRAPCWISSWHEESVLKSHCVDDHTILEVTKTHQSYRVASNACALSHSQVFETGSFLLTYLFIFCFSR